MQCNTANTFRNNKKKTFEFEKRNFSSVNGLRDVSVINRLPISIIFSLRKIIGIKYKGITCVSYYLLWLFSIFIFGISFLSFQCVCQCSFYISSSHPYEMNYKKVKKNSNNNKQSYILAFYEMNFYYMTTIVPNVRTGVCVLFHYNFLFSFNHIFVFSNFMYQNTPFSAFVCLFFIVFFYIVYNGYLSI